MIHFENVFDIPELFENLNIYINGKSRKSLLFSSQKLYKKYISDKYTIRDNIGNFLHELKLNHIIKIHHNFNNFTIDELTRYHLDWLSIHEYFVHFNRFELTDILVYLIDRNKKYITSIPLFEQIVKTITCKEDNHAFIYRNPINYNQYYIIISQCDLKQLIVFFQHTVVSINVIASVIKQMLSKQKIDIIKIQHCLHYILLKTTFGHKSSQSDNYFINDIIFELIRSNQVELIRFLFQKRNFVKNFFDYQFMVLKAIELDKIEILGLIQELEKSLFLPQKKILFITSNVIYDVCERGSFHVLNWIVKHQLDKLINLGAYITSIYSGIFACENMDCLVFLFDLRDYFNNDSRIKLNESLRFMYQKSNITNGVYFPLVY